jgi:hypothetical protein
MATKLAKDGPGHVATAMLEQLADLDARGLSPETARTLLQMTFDPSHRDRVDALSAGARDGSLGPDERDERDEFLRVADLLAILQSRARQALARAGSSPWAPMTIPAEMDRRVRARAGGRCESCRLPQASYPLAFQVDHIIARQHGGATRPSDLALSCPRCNRNEGPNLAGLDGPSRQLTPLYHPRRDRWADHFRWRGPRLVGGTPVGRVTVRVLAINPVGAIALRRELITEGIFPPRLP